MLAANSEYFTTLFCSQLNEQSGEIIYFGEGSQDETRSDPLIDNNFYRVSQKFELIKQIAHNSKLMKCSLTEWT